MQNQAQAQALQNKALQEPTCTSNSLSDVVRWVDEDSIVFIYNNAEAIRLFALQSNDMDCKKNRIIMVLCTISDLLEDGEWNWHIKSDTRIEHTNAREFVEQNASNFRSVFWFTV